MKTIRWGIVGLGGIAHKFVKDLKKVKGAQITAVASRNSKKAVKFKKLYNAKYAFGDYTELFTCKDVDVVYIATPHTFHKSIAIDAMNQGKNVLCEKPLGVNESEVLEMISCAKKNNVFLMEALWSRFNPSICKVKELIENGGIGNIQYLKADFAFYAMDRDTSGRVLSTELAGGSLLDIGIYPIFLAYLILGKPDKILATSKFHTTGVEVQTSIVLEYENAQAILYSGFTSKSDTSAEISGSSGSLYLPGRWHEASSYILKKENSIETIEDKSIHKGYTHEIEEVQMCLSKGMLESERWTHQNSIDLIKILDQVRKQTGIVFPFEK
ncbi:MAG: Gfo/Idh/MocA family oxidoreductase [Cellulophaga sp.]